MHIHTVNTILIALKNIKEVPSNLSTISYIDVQGTFFDIDNTKMLINVSELGKKIYDHPQVIIDTVVARLFIFMSLTFHRRTQKFFRGPPFIALLHTHGCG